MATNSHSYFKKLIGVELHEEKQKKTFVFQKERIVLKRSEEIIFLKDVHPEIKKEFTITDDELIIEAEIPNSFKRFDALRSEDEKSRWTFAHRLVEQVLSHPYPRLNLIVCPENIVYSRGMAPSFIYYGVKDRLPPFAQDEERVWLETKAAVATVVDGSVTYEAYFKYYETLKLNEIGAQVMAMTNSKSLLDYLEAQLDLLEIKEQASVKLPKKKWRMTKWLSIGFGALVIPAFIFMMYFFIYEKPKNEAYVESHEYYLARNHSEVVTTLSPYRVKRMPYIVLYELAHSYVINERLDDERKMWKGMDIWSTEK